MKAKLLIVAASLAVLAGCTDAPSTVRLLESQGYTDVQTTGYSFFACSQDDTYATGFTAKTASGNSISGTVCSGMFLKGSTIRFN